MQKKKNEKDFMIERYMRSSSVNYTILKLYSQVKERKDYLFTASVSAVRNKL